MTFTEKIEKLLASNHIKEVIDEFLKFLNEVPQSNIYARSDANTLRGQIIVLSGRFTELNNKINTNTLDASSANQEKSTLINSFIHVLNQLPSNYPDLNTHLEEKNEESEWKDSQKKNTIEGYQVYFNKYPNGKYKADTIKLIGELEEVKQKQDDEIKRLALLEKKRREYDKMVDDSQNPQPGPNGQSAYQAAASPYTAPPAKSKKGLYIGLGIAAVIILIVIMNNRTSTYEQPLTPLYDQSTAAPLNDEPATGTNSTGAQQVSNDERVKDRSSDETIKAELISAIRLGDDASINASYTLNPEPLYKSFIGEGLKTQLSGIDWLKSNGLIAATTLEQQDFKNFKISADGLEAEVRVVETWTNVYYVAGTNKCYGRVPTHKAPQTIFLKKSEGGWLTTSIVHDNLVAPEMVACE